MSAGRRCEPDPPLGDPGGAWSECAAVNVTIDLLQPYMGQEAGGLVASVNATDDLVWELQDQVQRVGRMVSWLVTHAGGDPAVIGAVPDGGPAEGTRAA